MKIPRVELSGKSKTLFRKSMGVMQALGCAGLVLGVTKCTIENTLSLPPVRKPGNTVLVELYRGNEGYQKVLMDDKNIDGTVDMVRILRKGIHVPADSSAYEKILFRPGYESEWTQSYTAPLAVRMTPEQIQEFDALYQKLQKVSLK